MMNLTKLPVNATCFVGQIQTKYGIAQEAAEQQVKDFETTHKFDKTHC